MVRNCYTTKRCVVSVRASGVDVASYKNKTRRIFLVYNNGAVRTGTFPLNLKTLHHFIHRSVADSTFHLIKIERWDQLIQQTTTAVNHEVQTFFDIWLAFLSTTDNVQGLDIRCSPMWQQHYFQLESRIASHACFNYVGFFFFYEFPLSRTSFRYIVF